MSSTPGHTRRYSNIHKKPMPVFLADAIRNSTFNHGKRVAVVYVNPAEVVALDGVTVEALDKVKLGFAWVEEVQV